MDASTVDACPVCDFFSNFVHWVCAIFLLAGGASDACVLDLVLSAGSVDWNLFLCFLVRCLWVVFVDWSTLVTHGVDNWGAWGFGGIIYIFCCVLLMVYSGTLELAGASVVVVGYVSLALLCRNACYVNWISCRISSPPLLLSKFFISLAQSSVAAITLSECVMVGRVIFLWLKWMVYVKSLLLVDFMRHRCVR